MECIRGGGGSETLFVFGVGSQPGPAEKILNRCEPRTFYNNSSRWHVLFLPPLRDCCRRQLGKALLRSAEGPAPALKLHALLLAQQLCLMSGAT